MSAELLPTALAIAVALVVAWHLDRRTWSRRSVEELERMVSGPSWKGWKNGLVELQRRNAEIRHFIPGLLTHLLDESHIAREAARITLGDTFPDLKEQLRGYRSSDTPAVSREK
jgi:hypothetical protein